MRLAAALVFVATVSSCSGAVSPGADRVPPGTGDFQTGYMHGCASGYSIANRPRHEMAYRRDEESFAGNAEYREGWYKGFVACHEEEIRFPHGDTGNRVS